MRSKERQIEAIAGCHEFLLRISDPHESPFVPLRWRKEARSLLLMFPDLEELIGILQEHLREPEREELERRLTGMALVRQRYMSADQEHGKLDGKLAELVHEAYCRVGVPAKKPAGS